VAGRRSRTHRREGAAARGGGDLGGDARRREPRGDRARGRGRSRRELGERPRRALGAAPRAARRRARDRSRPRGGDAGRRRARGRAARPRLAAACAARRRRLPRLPPRGGRLRRRASDVGSVRALLAPRRGAGRRGARPLRAPRVRADGPRRAGGSAWGAHAVGRRDRFGRDPRCGGRRADSSTPMRPGAGEGRIGGKPNARPPRRPVPSPP
jgi:hypothetical protein